MKILAVTCYTGGEELCHMTDHCLRSLQDCVHKSVELQIAVTAQGADWDTMAEMSASYIHVNPKNVGFGYGMNRAIELGVKAGFEPDYVLCFNNDLQFPKRLWLSELLLEASPDRICVPATNKSALRVQSGPIKSAPLRLQEMSAYCWLVPFKWCQWLKEHHGFWLFDEEFGSYGEDNWTAFLLSKIYGPRIFYYVRRSWVKHLRGRTAAVVKPNRKRSSALLVDRLKQQLTNPRLRGDLQKWAKSYIHILTPRC